MSMKKRQKIKDNLNVAEDKNVTNTLEEIQYGPEGDDPYEKILLAHNAPEEATNF